LSLLAAGIHSAGMPSVSVNAQSGKVPPSVGHRLVAAVLLEQAQQPAELGPGG
jgi:hypothetical protein